MPRYFIDIGEGSNFVVDEEGVNLPNVKAGQRFALHTISEIARDCLPKGGHQTFMAAVRDESGAAPYCVKLTLSDRWNDDDR